MTWPARCAVCDSEGYERPDQGSQGVVTLFYHDPKTRTTYTFYGRAWTTDDPDTRTAVFVNSPARERQMDFRRRGVAIIVDLDMLEGRAPAGRILMLRG